MFADSSYRDVSALQGIASSVPVGVPMFARRQEEATAITNNFSVRHFGCYIVEPFRAHNSSLEGAMKLKFGPFCSS